MIWLVYNFIFTVAFVLMLPHFLLRMVRRGGYARGFLQRVAWYDRATCERLTETERVWVHAVSVGEMFVALHFVKHWRAKRPDLRFVVTTTTSTGHAIALKELDPDDVLLYFPVDFYWVAKRAMRLIHPKAIVLVELELWPNMVRMARNMGTPVFLINGRVSEHSYKGYRLLKTFTRPLLGMIDILCCQSAADAKRMRELGAAESKIRNMGSAKYDVASGDGAHPEAARAILSSAGFKPTSRILLGGSTWPGEEAALLDTYTALRSRYRDLVLVLVPRHVERVGSVLAEIKARGLHASRRSEIKEKAIFNIRAPDVLVVDTTGELRNFYACADVIFVGKSLTHKGGQNPIEPALFAKPIIVGPHMENFASVMDDFRAADAMIQIQNSANLRTVVSQLLDDPELCRTYGQRARDVVQAKTGAVRATIDLINRLWPAN